MVVIDKKNLNNMIQNHFYSIEHNDRDFFVDPLIFQCHFFTFELIFNIKYDISNTHVIKAQRYYNHISIPKKWSKKYCFLPEPEFNDWFFPHIKDSFDNVIDILHREFTRIFNLKICPCNNNLIFNNRPHCESCFITNTLIDRDCPICLEQTMLDNPLFTHKEKCCGLQLHTSCKNKCLTDTCIICRIPSYNNNNNDTDDSQSDDTSQSNTLHSIPIIPALSDLLHSTLGDHPDDYDPSNHDTSSNNAPL